MKDTLISVIVPVYNVQDYLEKCVVSICKQSYKKLEIILIDDGSTDRSGEMCDAYKSNDSRIVVLHKSNGGLSSARNEGLKIAKGDYICFVDSDDFIHKDMIAKLYLALIQESAELAVCDYSSSDSFTLTMEKVVYQKDEAISHLFDDQGYKFYAWNKMYKRSLFENIEFPNGKNYEDIVTTYNIINKCNKIVYIKSELYHYTIRKGSITNVNFSEKNYDLIDAINYVELHIKKEYPALYNTILAGYCAYYISFINLAILANKRNKKLERKFIIIVRENCKHIRKSKRIGLKRKILIQCFSLFPNAYALAYRKLHK